MKKHLSILAFCFNFIHGYAQVDPRIIIDSLQKQLLKASDDTNKVNLLNQLSRKYQRIDPEEGIKFGELGLELAKKINWKPGIAASNNGIGNHHFDKGDYQVALENYLVALGIYKELGNKRMTAGIENNIGNIYKTLGNYSKALEQYFKALKINEANGNKQWIFVNISNIQTIYHYQKNLDKALEYALIMIKKGDEIGNKAYSAQGECDVADVYCQLKNYPKAAEHYDRSLKMMEETGDKMGLATTVQNIAIYYFNRKMFGKAMENNKRALNLAGETGNKLGISLSLNNIGGCILSYLSDTSASTVAARAGNVPGITIPGNRTSLLNNAIDCLERSLGICREINAPSMMMDCYANLSDAYKLRHDYRKAFEYINESRVIKDSIFSKDNNNKIARLEVEQEYQRKYLTDSLESVHIEKTARMQLQKQKSFTYLGLSGVLLLAGFSFFLTKERGKSERERRKADNLVKQKEMLLKEIHHRVKNNLQVISVLLDLQLDTISDTAARKALTQGMSRIKSISLIHQQLYQEDHVTFIEFSRFAEDLMEQVTAVFKQQGQNVSLMSEIPETFLDIDTAIPLGLILNELITNSYKYAFGGNKDGCIKIGIERDEQYYKLTYSDNGPGLPQGYEMGKSNTLGMMVIGSLCQQLNGDFMYDWGNNDFIIRFMDTAERNKIA